MFLVLVLCFFILLLRRNKKEISRIFSANAILIIASLINIAFAAIVAMKGKHQLVSVELFSTIVIISLFYNLRTFIAANEIKIFIFCSLAFLVLYGPIYKCRRAYYDAYQVMIENAKQAKDGMVVAKEYENLCVGYEGWLSERFAMRDQASWGFNKRGLSLVLSNGKDDSLIKFILPDTLENIARLCVEANKVDNNVYKGKSSDYYVVRIPPGELEGKKVSLYLQPGFVGRVVYKFMFKKGAIPDTEFTLTPDNTFYFENYLYYVVSYGSPIKAVTVC